MNIFELLFPIHSSTISQLIVLYIKEVFCITYIDNKTSHFHIRYEQSDGQKRNEEGVLKNPGAEDESIAVKGSYAWVDQDGVTYVVNYVADENGFQPTIEQGPGGAVPSAVVASLLG